MKNRLKHWKKLKKRYPNPHNNVFNVNVLPPEGEVPNKTIQ
jgi:hypothetical protein